ncbi:hypothetical protein TIFTF001_003495 [Ficus carica]|uniref:Uncharacterized protein n=1 Tax=Ficus carica TaxID=3494 RepID=A0AA87ZS15_FICCA|nr:hypothetical protein TIFTF001_003495 [Ficus carica]
MAILDWKKMQTRPCGAQRLGMAQNLLPCWLRRWRVVHAQGRRAETAARVGPTTDTHVACSDWRKGAATWLWLAAAFVTNLKIFMAQLHGSVCMIFTLL